MAENTGAENTGTAANEAQMTPPAKKAKTIAAVAPPQFSDSDEAPIAAPLAKPTQSSDSDEASAAALAKPKPRKKKSSKGKVSGAENTGAENTGSENTGTTAKELQMTLPAKELQMTPPAKELQMTPPAKKAAMIAEVAPIAAPLAEPTQSYYSDESTAAPLAKPNPRKKRSSKGKMSGN